MRKSIQTVGTECVACGERFFGDNHHCDEKRITRIEAGYKSHAERRAYTPSEGDRLDFGFSMMYRDER